MMGLLNNFKLFSKPEPVKNPFLGSSTQDAKIKKPIVAYKKLFLNYDSGNKTINFRATTAAYSDARGYGVTDISRCGKGLNHTGPLGNKPSIDRECTCGFHAYHTLDEAQSHRAQTWGGITAEVVLSGYCIEYENGYRAEKQRTTKLYMEDCKRCEDVTPHRAATAFIDSNGILIPACLTCALRYDKSWGVAKTVDEVAAAITYPEDYRFTPIQFISLRNATPTTRYELEHNGVKKRTFKPFPFSKKASNK